MLTDIKLAIAVFEHMVNIFLINWFLSKLFT